MNRISPIRKRWLVLLLFTLSCFPLCACIWISGTTKDGKAIRISGFGPAKRLQRFLEVDLPMRGAEMEIELRDLSDSTNRNDLAVAFIFQGKYQEAIEILEQLEKEKPGEYFTASNLGTALELSGRDEDALHWINESIRRNPDSHEGTEWLHVKILEAKIKAAKDPEFFKVHSVLDLDYSQIDRDAKFLSVGGQQRDLQAVEYALKYQLEERLQFVKSKDAPVASLLFDYAAISAATHSLEDAKELLHMALDFGYPGDQVEPLLARYDRLIVVAKIRKWTIYGSIALIVIGLLIYAMKRRWIVYQRCLGLVIVTLFVGCV